MSEDGEHEKTGQQETGQSAFWRGSFGDAYTERNTLDPARLSALLALWRDVLRTTVGAPPTSILEVGANLGMNLRALRLLTGATLHAVEPNASARRRLTEDGVVPTGNVHDAIAQSLPLADSAVDLAFTSGVLIHVAPEDHEAVCREMNRVSRRYIVCIEYFSDKLEEIPYRGHSGVLFKRDFGGLWLDTIPGLRLLDYGFAWKRATGLDNPTWWLFEKT